MKHQDSRTLARILAVQYLFTKLEAQREEIDFDVFEPNTLLSVLEAKKFNNDLYEKLVDGTESNLGLIDEIITKLAPEWPIPQINAIDLTILRLAIWEGFIGQINPPKVVIDQAIEIAKMLGTDGAFVNGVLGNVLKNPGVQKILLDKQKHDE